MPKVVKAYVDYIDAANKKVGKFSMYLVFAMMGILLFESISRTIFDRPHIWVVEMAQFFMAAYYLLGGDYRFSPYFLHGVSAHRRDFRHEICAKIRAGKLYPVGTAIVAHQDYYDHRNFPDAVAGYRDILQGPGNG
jgi:hypothetical protein